MKRRFSPSRKLLVVGAAGVLLVGGGMVGAYMMGYLPGSDVGDHGLRGTLTDDQQSSITAVAGGHTSGVGSPNSGNGESPKDPSNHEAEEPNSAGVDAAHMTAEGNSRAGDVAGDHGGDVEDHGGDAASHVPPLAYEMPKPSSFNITVRALLQAQTLAAHGSSADGASQRDIMKQLQMQLQDMDATKITQRELDSLGVYLLSGGDPRGLSGLIADIPADSHIKKLLRGVRAYVIGDAENARKDLSDVDMRSLSAALGARLQLALAALALPEDVKAQTVALKRAAGLAPGTLIEEAALRRLLALNLKSADRGSFTKITNRYMRRFPTSLYIEDFISTFGKGVLQFESLRKPVSHDLIDRVYSRLPRDLARRAALGVARRSADSGYRDLCLFLTRVTLLEILVEGQDLKRARLFALACSLVDSPVEVLAELNDLDAATLPQEDVELREDAMRMATAIIGKDLPVGIDKFQGPEVPDTEVASSQVSATQQLEASEELLKEARK